MTTFLLTILVLVVVLATMKVIFSGDSTKDTGKNDSEQIPSSKKEPVKSGKSKESFKGNQIFQKAFSKSMDSRFPIIPLYRFPNIPEKIFGRKKVFGDIVSQLEENGAIIGLHGIDGIGKTAMGLWIAKSLFPNYREEHLYIDMRANSSTPLSLEEILSKIISFFRPHLPLPQTLQELTALYRITLRGKKIILFVDNVIESGEIECLIPPKSCMLAVTSDKGLEIPGMVSKKLETLDHLDSHSLLLEISPRIGFWNKEIAQLCHNLPLTLNLSARFLSANPKVDPSEFVTQFREELRRIKPKPGKEPQAGLEAVLNIEIRFLPEKTVSVLRKAIIFPDSFEAKAQAFICEDANNEHLGTLLMNGLVWSNKNSSRYYLHDEIRRSLEKRKKDSEQALGSKRLSTYFMTLLTTAHDLYVAEVDKRERGLNIFDTEWENIRAGQTWAMENSLVDKEADSLCQAYAEAGEEFLILRQSPVESAKWFEAGLDSSKRQGDLEAENKYLLLLGQMCNKLSENQRAFDYLEQALELSQKLENSARERDALENLAKTHLALGKPHRAIECLESQLDLIRNSSNGIGEENVLQSLGTVYRQVGELERAMEFFHQELDLVKESGDIGRKGRILSDLGELNSIRKEHEKAIEFFEEGLKLLRQADDQEGQVDLIKRMGDACADFEKPQKALQYYEEGLELAAETGDDKSRASMIAQMGKVNFDLKHFLEAAACFQKAVPLFKKFNNKRMEGEMLWNTSLALHNAGNNPETILHASSALEIFKKLGHPDLQKMKEQYNQWAQLYVESSSGKSGDRENRQESQKPGSSLP